MSRYPTGGQLPPIQWDERDSPNHARFNHRNPITGGYSAAGNYNAPSFDNGPHAALISRAGQLEQDQLAGGLSGGGGGTSSPSWQEKHARAVLQENIQTVTLAVKKISNEIEAIEEQLRNRMKVSEHTNNSVKSLEIQHVGSISDLRQRVGRCDISIAKLSGDSRRFTDEIASINKQTLDSSAQQSRSVGDSERKISILESRLDHMSSDQYTKVDTVGSETKHSVALLDAKTKSQFEELQRALETVRMRGDADRQLLERGLAATVEAAVSKRDAKQELFERKILDRLEEIEKKIIKQDGAVHAQSDRLQEMLEERMKRLEVNLRQEQEALGKQVQHDLDEAEKQSENGFNRVKDSMTTMRTVMEGKQQLLAENLQKQLANVKKLVVLT